MSRAFQPFGWSIGAVLHNDHSELTNLVEELARRPDTPGVVRDLAVTLDRRASVHLAVSERLLLPCLDGCGRDDLVEAIVGDDDRLRARLGAAVGPDDPPDALEVLAQALAEHIRFEEEVVVPALGAVGTAECDALGLRFSKLADSGYGSSRPGSSLPSPGRDVRRGSEAPDGRSL